MAIVTERLSPTQLEAFTHVKKAARELDEKSKAAIAAILLRTHLDEAILAQAMQHIQSHAQVVLHFHPDRLTASGQSVAESLLQVGLYRNQFDNTSDIF
jgi:hypothetical protein